MINTEKEMRMDCTYPAKIRRNNKKNKHLTEIPRELEEEDAQEDKEIDSTSRGSDSKKHLE